MKTKPQIKAGERTQLQVGQLVVVDGKYQGEIRETRLGDGGFYRVEVDTDKEKHEFWTVDFNRMEVIPPIEQSFSIEIMSASFGNWNLGYGWVHVSIGSAKTIGLALYARFRDQEPARRVVANVKDAMSFFETHKVAAKAAGKLMAAAMDAGDFGDICKNDSRIATASQPPYRGGHGGEGPSVYAK
jgi:hypothetical protein